MASSSARKRSGAGKLDSVDDLVNFKTSIREFVEGDTHSDAIAFLPTDPSGAYAPEPTAARRMRLNPDDFKQQRYTKDCPGCVFT